jgi:hypothetical protein
MNQIHPFVNPFSLPKSTANVRIVGAILVIARSNPSKKFGLRFGRTQKIKG